MKLIAAVFIAVVLAFSAPAYAQAPCVNPVDFGAVADDAISDRAAFQAALDSVATGGTICVPTGRFVFERAPLSSYNRFAALATHGHDIVIEGVAGSTIALVGDQGAKSTILFSIDASATNITLRGLTFESTQATNTDEQTHLVATSGVCGVSIGTCNPIRNILIEDCIFNHPRATPTTRRGDSIRLLGNSLTTLVLGVTIKNNLFINAGRSAVELQRGLSDVDIFDNDIHCFDCDQAIDGEATAVTPGLEVYNTRIFNNVVTLGAGAQGDYDIALTSGVGAEIFNNSINRGIALVRSKSVHIHTQTILANMAKAGGIIEVTNVCESLLIEGVTLVRSGIPAPLIRVVPTENGHCVSFKVRNSNLIQRTASFGIFSQSTNALITDNTFSWTGPEVAGFQGSAAIFGAGTVAPVTSFVATGNVSVGSLQAVVSVQGAVSGLIHSNKSVGTNVLCLGSGC